MNFVFATPSISDYTDAAICYGFVECLLRAAPDSSVEVYSRGTLYEVHCDLSVENAGQAAREGLLDALDEILEGVASTQQLWVYAAASGGIQPKDGDSKSSISHLRGVLKDLSSGRSEGVQKFLESSSRRTHRCQGGWTSLALVPEWGRQKKGLYVSPSRGSKLCQWCYALSWVGLHNFALFTRHQRDSDVSCTAALMIPGPSEKSYSREELLAVRELGTRYQQERPLEAPPAPYAFLLWALSRGETILPLTLSGRSFLASITRFDRSGRPPQYSVAVRNFHVAPVWRLLRFVAEAKTRTYRFHRLIDALLRDDRGANADIVQRLSESILFSDIDGIYRSLRSIRGLGLEVEAGIVDAAFQAIG